MYTVTVEAGFRAVHRVRVTPDTVEPEHGHDWVARAHFARQSLDANGMVVDFVQARRTLTSVVGQLHRTDLNEHQAFEGLNPTAEVIARHVYERLLTLGLTTIRRVEVMEAPGCVAGYELSEPVEGAPRLGLRRDRKIDDDRGGS